MMFVGVNGAPSENWPELPYTTINATPMIREKPFIASDDKGFNVKIPAIKQNSSGPDWINGVKAEKTLTLNEFYVVRPGTDNSKSINSALKKGRNLLITPGRYFLDKSIKVTKPGTVIMESVWLRLSLRMEILPLRFRMLTE